VSNLPISSPYRSTPDVPVSEAERNQLNSRLNAAFTAGTLDQDDFQVRLDRLFAAQKLGELVPVVEGLPPLETYATPAIVGAGTTEPGQLVAGRNSAKLALAVIAGVVALVILIAILLVILV